MNIMNIKNINIYLNTKLLSQKILIIQKPLHFCKGFYYIFLLVLLDNHSCSNGFVCCFIYHNYTSCNSISAVGVEK